MSQSYKAKVLLANVRVTKVMISNKVEAMAP
jgi:hypothetical protein